MSRVIRFPLRGDIKFKNYKFVSVRNSVFVTYMRVKIRNGQNKKYRERRKDREKEKIDRVGIKMKR